MLLGLALIAVPLLVAVLTAALQIRQLADTGQKIVVEGFTAARASQELFSEISSLERTATIPRSSPFSVLSHTARGNWICPSPSARQPASLSASSGV